MAYTVLFWHLFSEGKTNLPVGKFLKLNRLYLIVSPLRTDQIKFLQNQRKYSKILMNWTLIASSTESSTRHFDLNLRHNYILIIGCISELFSTLLILIRMYADRCRDIREPPRIILRIMRGGSRISLQRIFWQQMTVLAIFLAQSSNNLA